jgi:hypothetical protein
MNKRAIFVFSLFGIYAFLYAQTQNNKDNILSHLSLNYQYNTLTDAQGTEWPIPWANTHHYFFGFDGYSNAIISESEYRIYNGRISSTETQWTLQFASVTGNQFVTFGGGNPESINNISDIGITYNFLNGQLTSWNYYHMNSFGIEYTNNNEIRIKTSNSIDGSMPPHLRCYLNTPRDELLGIFLRLYLEGISYILNRTWETREKHKIWPYERLFEKQYDNNAMILESLNGRTARELAIFRNFIFARHNYNFRSDEWNIFFRTYYRNDYNGTRTSDEVMSVLTEHERRVLELIIEQEKI